MIAEELLLNENATGFEGPEKLLEIWFSPSSSNDVTGSSSSSLRNVPKHKWQSMLQLVRCEVLNIISNDRMDAYLLSESSMFVTDNEVIIKTCGTTTLLLCLDSLLNIAQSVGMDNVDYVFYSRKSFMFPDQQLYPHNDWGTEVQWLDRYFENGSAYVVGKLNSDHWYCFVQHRDQSPSSEIDTDQTLEILMTGLDPDAAQVFYPEHAYIEPSDSPTTPDSDNGKMLKLTKALQSIYPNSTIDDHQFSPCGYSCNGLTPHGYFTVHVTPEHHCSYASFETNIPPMPRVGKGSYPETYTEIVDKIIQFFKPKRFTMSLFLDHRSVSFSGPEHKTQVDTTPTTNTTDKLHNGVPSQVQFGTRVKGYKRQDKIIYEFSHYDLLYYHYAREGYT